MPPLPKPPPVEEIFILGFAALAAAFNPTLITPKEALVYARAFVAEAEAQYPEAVAVIKTP